MKGLERLRFEAALNGWSIQQNPWGPKGHPVLTFERTGMRIECELYKSYSRVKIAHIYRGGRVMDTTHKHTDILIYLRTPVALAQYQDEAIGLLRRAAREPSPVDAGLVGMLVQTVQYAYEAGEAHAVQRFQAAVKEVLAAWQTYLDKDDLDAVVNALTELMELVE